MSPILKALLVLAAATSLTCGAGSNGDWYYHWNCNGDMQCLATNPTGQPSGSSDEGPDEVNCTQLLQFAIHFWGPAATNSCDQSPSGAPAQTTITGFTPAASAPGDTVTITGTNFPATLSSITVTIDGMAATVTAASSTQIQITVPAMGDFAGSITLTTPAGTAVSSLSFSVVNNLYGVAWTGRGSSSWAGTARC